MTAGFLFNTVFPIAILAVTAVRNLLYCEKTSIHYRLSALGLSFAISIGVYGILIPHFALGRFLSVGITSFFCWLSSLLFISFLIDMTASRRSRYFPFLYGIPFVLAAVTAFVPHSYEIVILGFIGLVLCVWYSLFFMIAWIRAATDARARRDGEWMLMVNMTFAAGLFIASFHSIEGTSWLIAFWFLVIHFAVNYMKIFNQLTNLENQLIIDNVFDVVLILDSAGNIVRMNRRGGQITEFSPITMNGLGVETIVKHPDLDKKRRKEWLDRFGWYDHGTGIGRSPSIDACILTSGGEEILVDLRIVCLLDLGKKKTGYIVSATDMRITRQLIREISDREYATRDLALSESKFSRMFIFNPTGILIVDLETLAITDANPAIEEILDTESCMLTGKNLGEIGLEMTDPSYDAFLERIRIEGSVPEFSARIKVNENTERKCRLSAVSFDLNRTRRMLLSVADVTQQEQMREALNRKQKVETIGILAGGIAHDFNNVLAVILGHIGLAKMRIVDPHARMPVEKAEQACLRAREMTRQLLAFSRGGKPVLGVCDTRQIIIDSAMISVNDTAVACLFDIDKDIWPLMADKIQIGQVISNLVGNAVDAMDKSGIITIKAKNRDFKNISASKRPLNLDSKPIPAAPYVEIQIQDQGPGIPDSIKASIFDPFFTTKEKGTGLGLSIVYSVIQNHSGAIHLESSPGSGTTFYIYLPAEPFGSLVQSGMESPALSGKKRVLLMDDDALVRETASSLISTFGYDVISTVDGRDALEKYREAMDTDDRFDFCILDLIVPDGMPGTECAKEILAINPDAILLVSSGYSDDPVLSHYQDYGFKGIIPKPYTLEELGQALANALVF